MQQITSWIFDLDNTLYSARDGVFRQISERMGRFVADVLEVHIDEAKKIQKRMFHQYGTTLAGMMREYGVDPLVFMNFVHDVDLSAMPRNPALATGLAQLPGQKVIYTNASFMHAGRVLAHLGLDHLFGGIFDIMAADYRPKPDPAPYRELVARHQIDPAHAVMVEDMAENLLPAKNMGMTTIWIDEADAPDHAHVPTPDYVDYRIRDLADFLHRIPALSSQEQIS